MTGQQSSRTGARHVIDGTVSTGATWWEDVDITEDGAAVADAEDWTWQLNFRSAQDSGVVLSLTTADGTLTIVQGSSATTLQIRVDDTALSALRGDYIADLASRDTDDRTTHWGHGVVTFVYEPVWSS